MRDDLDWNALVIPLSRDEILCYVRDEKWQDLRASLSGLPLEDRYDALLAWIEDNNYSRQTLVQVANYVNALKRGGMIK